jgi:hypothetical protein
MEPPAQASTPETPAVETTVSAVPIEPRATEAPSSAPPLESPVEKTVEEKTEMSQGSGEQIGTEEQKGE